MRRWVLAGLILLAIGAWYTWTAAQVGMNPIEYTIEIFRSPDQGPLT